MTFVTAGGPTLHSSRQLRHSSSMPRFELLASPWWVNLLVLIPFLAFVMWRRKGLVLAGWQLFYSGLFAIAFGFVEAVVVVYLRAAGGLLPGYHGTLDDVVRQAPDLNAQMQLAAQMPRSLMTIEPVREGATILMLVAVALLVGRTQRERWAMFLWVFAFWDIMYYVGLWATIRWPQSLTTPDVLFLVPVPWTSQVWYPVLVSSLSILAVLFARPPGGINTAPRWLGSGWTLPTWLSPRRIIRQSKRVEPGAISCGTKLCRVSYQADDW